MPSAVVVSCLLGPVEFPPAADKRQKKEEKRRDEELRVNASEREDGPHLFVGIRGVPSIFSFINLFLKKNQEKEQPRRKCAKEAF